MKMREQIRHVWGNMCIPKEIFKNMNVQKANIIRIAVAPLKGAVHPVPDSLNMRSSMGAEGAKIAVLGLASLAITNMEEDVTSVPTPVQWGSMFCGVRVIILLVVETVRTSLCIHTILIVQVCTTLAIGSVTRISTEKMIRVYNVCLTARLVGTFCGKKSKRNV